METKTAMVDRFEKEAPLTVVWQPFTPLGWGASPFNKNCWRALDGTSW